MLSPSLEVDFVPETINKLVEYHGVSLQAETIIHSDQGCHYTSHKFINILYDKKLRQSMSRKGNCWDNAPQESFFGRMKDHIKPELAECTSFADVQVIIDNYIDYYNNRRYQWHLARLSPNEFYKFVTTGKYPLDIPNVPAMPAIKRILKSLVHRQLILMIINKPTEYHTGWDGMSIYVDTENVMCPLLCGTKQGNVQNQGYHFSVDV